MSVVDDRTNIAINSILDNLSDLRKAAQALDYPSLEHVGDKALVQAIRSITNVLLAMRQIQVPEPLPPETEPEEKGALDLQVRDDRKKESVAHDRHVDMGWWGRIVPAGPNGEPDYEDERYWVRGVYLDSSNEWQLYSQEHPLYSVRWVTAYNVAEYSNHTHFHRAIAPIVYVRPYARVVNNTLEVVYLFSFGGGVAVYG